ncbi:RICIN domain-containing protein [Paenibacillus pasadenensis]|uniref:RICIN domain-containing protein n=1 Tax=Paenibacillus pasadenensis TaxID=217090 RepID=UPI00203BC8AD|nr:RICIN domain-containing protein [Paenibacillus pasadenensis]MCM3746100.1 RICIN domain-containing protein [Paenibacillus pasadenensis]
MASIVQTLINNALAAHQSEVIIPPAVYHLTDTTVINGAHNFTVIADGCHFIMTNFNRVFNINNCVNLTIQGVTMNYDPLPFTQGVVIFSDPVALTIKVQIDQGYPVHAYSARIIIFDPFVMKQKEGVNLFSGHVSFDPVLPNTLVITDVSTGISVGDWATLSTSPAVPHSIAVTGCTSTTWRNCTLHTSTGFGYIEGSGKCGTVMDNFRIVPGPKPAGAIVPPLLTTIIDAIQFNNIEVGPTLENCVIQSASDDSFSIQTPAYMAVLNASGTSEYIAFRSDPLPLPAGDTLCQFFAEPSTIVSATHVAYGSFPIDPEIEAKIASAQQGDPYDINKNAIYLIEFSAVPAFGVGDFVFNPRYSGSGFIFRNNTIYSQGRGMLLKASNGLIENNMFTAATQSIVVTPEGNANTQSGCSQNLTIRGNYFLRSGYHHVNFDSNQAATVCFVAANVTGTKAFNNMLIEDNIFDSINGLNLQILNCEDVQVNNNSFLNTHPNVNSFQGGSSNIDQTTNVFIRNSDSVSFQGNVTRLMNSYGSIPSVISTFATNITGLPGGLTLLNKINIPIDPAKTYAIINRNSNKALQTVSNGTADGTKVDQNTFNSAAASQHWKFIPNGFNFNILHVASGKFLDINGASISSGADAVIFTGNGSLSQQWAFANQGGGFFKIKNVNSGLNLNMQGNGTANGVLVVQLPDGVSLVQSFRLIEIP